MRALSRCVTTRRKWVVAAFAEGGSAEKADTVGPIHSRRVSVRSAHAQPSHDEEFRNAVAEFRPLIRFPRRRLGIQPVSRLDPLHVFLGPPSGSSSAGPLLGTMHCRRADRPLNGSRYIPVTRSLTPTGATPSMTPDSRNVLWKRSWDDEHLQRICGFANAQGGVLEIGKDDAGEVVGVRGVLGLLEEIPNKAESLLGIAVDVNLKSDSGREYIEVVVAPHRNPVSYRGEFHYRTGSTKRVLDGADLRRLLRARFGRRWDGVASPGVGLNDLDGRAVDRFRRRAVECERLPPEVLDESLEEIVENLDLRQGAHLKRTAALLFHPSPHRLVPGAYVKLGCFRGPELLFEDVVRGDLFTQVDVTMDLLYTKYTRGLISYDGIYRVETFPVPRSVMREAVINAVVHRDYASHAPIRIRVRDDRISIQNAARLTRGWSAEELAGERSSRPHNPSIAHAFLRAGLIEAWGLGIRRMMDTCRELGNPTPRWRPDAGGDGLRVTFPFSEAYRAADAVARGIVAPRTTERTTAKATPVAESARKLPVDNQKTARKQPEGRNPSRGLADRILAFLRDNPSASRREIAEELAGTTEGSIRYQLDKLKESNRLRRVGPDRGGRWMVLDGDGAGGGSASRARSGKQQDPGDGALHDNRQKTARNGGQPPEEHQKPAGTARKQPEPLPLPDRILAVLRQNPSTSRRELAAALDTTQSTVRYRLDKLRAAGRIERVGPDKGGHWKVLDVPQAEAGPSR